MDDNAIAALKAAYEATTEGEWFVHGTSAVVTDKSSICFDAKLRDAEFIVAAHEHVPALLAEVERLQHLETTVNDWIAQQEQNYRNTSGSHKNQYYVDAATELRDALNAP